MAATATGTDRPIPENAGLQRRRFHVRKALEGRGTLTPSLRVVGNGDLLHLDASVRELGHHHGDLLMEPPGTAGAGIEPETAAPLLLQILVGVAEHHHVHPGQVCRDLFPVVDHVKGNAIQRECEMVGNGRRPLLIIVAPDNIERGILPQLIHDRLPVDVAAVDNGVGGFQMLRHFGPQQAVGVGENGELHFCTPLS